MQTVTGERATIRHTLAKAAFWAGLWLIARYAPDDWMATTIEPGKDTK
jgi:hypothetical protein